MRTILTTTATTAGADVTIYDRKAMQNILLDAVDSHKTICLIDEFNSASLVPRNNGVDIEHTIRIAFVKQVNFEETAELNETDLTALMLCCKKYIIALIDSQYFNRFPRVPVRKHQERETDFNAIGYEMTLTLTENEGYAEC